MPGSRRRPTIKTKNNKTELLNTEEGEDNMGDGVGKTNGGTDAEMKTSRGADAWMFYGF